MERHDVTHDEIVSFLAANRNWGRWGDDDEVGAPNMITAEKRLEATQLVQTGQPISLARPWPANQPGGDTSRSQYFMRPKDRPEVHGGMAEDYIGAMFHGPRMTHIDALCHCWTDDGMWGGRSPTEEIGFTGSKWGGIDTWKNGIVTRGVLLDVPFHRGEPFVTIEQPVHGWELDEIVKARGIEMRPGDAVLVHSGREAWDREKGSWHALTGSGARPGLDATCLWFLRENDCSVLVWDMTDCSPKIYGPILGVHNAIPAFGLALVDQALLEPLALACREQNRWEFMFVVAPLVIQGGTGSPVNPLAIL